MKKILNFFLYPARPLIRRLRQDNEDRMERIGAAVNQTLQSIRYVQDKKKEIEAVTNKREEELANELEWIMNSATPRILGKKPEEMELYKKAAAAQRGEISQEELFHYLHKHGHMNGGAANLIHSLRSSQREINISEELQKETAAKLHEKIQQSQNRTHEEAMKKVAELPQFSMDKLREEFRDIEEDPEYQKWKRANGKE
eukprot:TRINITY_DN4005_c0_g1_i2.p1 TRINITY_DN4005_c0_g1~~TRINITY_DN4005_c0_g1_i2.p1  ORF type:complete len:200 (+),score=44.31 TRINITY_DN4005_c0_g1_i2:49-648(+)